MSVAWAVAVNTKQIIYLIELIDSEPHQSNYGLIINKKVEPNVLLLKDLSGVFVLSLSNVVQKLICPMADTYGLSINGDLHEHKLQERLETT